MRISDWSSDVCSSDLITGDAAKQLFADAGLDLDAMYAAAGKRGFKAVPLDATVSFDLKSTVTEKSSRNVIGVLPGTERPGEAVVYMGHWDHLGKHEGEEGRSEERRVGKEGVSTCSSRWSPTHDKKKQQK